MFIETPRLARFATMSRLVLGPHQRKFMDLVRKHEGQKAPKPGTITSTGKLRKHIGDDLVGKGLLDSKVVIKKDGTGGVVYLMTALGKKALKVATTSKAPPSGYRKVQRRGRPRLRVVGGSRRAA